MVLPRLTLILGGAASGKSAHAEALFEGVARRVYLATGQAFDDEMRAKIELHIARRGPDWRTVEAPLEAAGALAGLAEGESCLFDCATFWLSNHLLAGSDLADESARLLAAIAACPAPLVVVSNEVGMSVVPENALARRYREAQGRLNIALAKAADRVVMVAAGLPMVLK